MADVAQLVEPRFVVPVVVSSSLIVRPIKKACEMQAFFVFHLAIIKTYQCPPKCFGFGLVFRFFTSTFLKS